MRGYLLVAFLLFIAILGETRTSQGYSTGRDDYNYPDYYDGVIDNEDDDYNSMELGRRKNNVKQAENPTDEEEEEEEDFYDYLFGDSLFDFGFSDILDSILDYSTSFVGVFIFGEPKVDCKCNNTQVSGNCSTPAIPGKGNATSKPATINPGPSNATLKPINVTTTVSPPNSTTTTKKP